MHSSTRPPDDSGPPLRNFQFSLRTLLVVMTLVGIVAAAFANDLLCGIFTYLGGWIVFLGYWRGRAEQYRLQSLAHEESPQRQSRLRAAALAMIAVPVAAGIAFCCTCSVAEAPFVRMTAVGSPEAAAAQSLAIRGFFVSIPLGTAALLFIYWATWPRSSRP
jgi:hypothetical protein